MKTSYIISATPLEGETHTVYATYDKKLKELNFLDENYKAITDREKATKFSFEDALEEISNLDHLAENHEMWITYWKMEKA